MWLKCEPVFKKMTDLLWKTIARRVYFSIFQKDYERCIYDKIYQYFNKIPSKQQYQLQQCFCMQICLLVIIEKRRKCLGIDGVNGTLLKDQ